MKIGIKIWISCWLVTSLWIYDILLLINIYGRRKMEKYNKVPLSLSLIFPSLGLISCFCPLVLLVVFVQHRSFKQLSMAVNLIGLSWNKIHAKKFSPTFATKYLGPLFRFFQWQPLLEHSFALMPFFSLCFSLMQNTFVIFWLPH